MRDRFSTVLATCGLLFGLLPVPQTIQAQSEGMYRVELMVFAYPAGGAAEQWDATPELAYPETTRYLTDARDQRDVPQAVGNPAGPTALADSSAAVELAPSGLSAAYVLLPATARELGAKAASMQSSGRYRVLFHEAWVQPMAGQSAAVPVVLDHSGDGGAWPELQGTVTLYKAGDYVLETNLWLNTRGDYLPGAWRMPPPPRGPVDAGMPANAASGLPDDGASDYPYRHAVLLQQTRKMRGGKVLYIDHPMLGVVAKITPLDAPAPVPEADTEIPPQASPAP